jgi:hypothetical protein
MLDFQLQSMRDTVTRLLDQNQPPLTVMIQIDHAKFVDVPFIADTSGILIDREPDGDLVPQLVTVQLGDLALALLGAKSVEDRIRGA